MNNLKNQFIINQITQFIKTKLGRKHPLLTTLVVALVVAIGGYITNPKPVNQLFQNKMAQTSNANTPSEAEAEQVMSESVKKQVGKKLVWHSYGNYEVNDNRTTVNIDVASAPYAYSEKDSQGRAHIFNGLLNKTAREYRSREETGNDAQIRPPGWHQVQYGQDAVYSHLYDRGHLGGYALVAGIKKFDASEANPANITTQTSWANQADDDTSRGQNYYETLVRRALDKNKTVRYKVTAVYDGANLLPSGNHLEAKSSDGSLEFNVFIPNVQPGVTIDYKTGKSHKS